VGYNAVHPPLSLKQGEKRNIRKDNHQHLAAKKWT